MSEKERLHNQLIRLGDMMGDGLDNESGGGWINKEYRKTLRALEPEIFQAQRANKRDKINERAQVIMAEKKSPCCTQPLKQTRSGANMFVCIKCDKRYKMSTKKK